MKDIMNKNVVVKVVLVCVVFMMSCTTSRKLPFKTFFLEPHTEQSLLEEVAKHDNDSKYTQISRFSGEYVGVQEQSSFKGYVRIAEDSLMMLSMSGMVGGEVMRVLMSPEESKTLNRLEETYVVEDFATSLQIIPLPFELLQAVLNYNFSELLEDYTLSIEDHMYVMTDSKMDDPLTYVKIDGSYVPQQVFYKDFKRNISVTVDYKSFLDVDGQKFPNEIVIGIQNRSNNATLSLTIKRVVFKDSMTFPFTVPERYLK